MSEGNPGRPAVCHEIADEPRVVAADQYMMVGQRALQEIVGRFPQPQTMAIGILFAFLYVQLRRRFAAFCELRGQTGA